MYSPAHSFVLALIVVGSLLSCVLGALVFQQQQQAPTVQGKQKAPAVPATSRTGKPTSSGPKIERLDAAELLGTYDANQVAANADFRGRWLDVVGRVVTVKQGFLHDEIILDAGIDFDIHTVHCSMAHSAREHLLDVWKGQWITIRGRCSSGSRWSVRLADCSFPK